MTKPDREQPEDLVLCRCEGVMAGTVEDAVARLGCRSVNEVKKITRAGMGPCLGTVCLHLVQRALADLAGPEAAAVPHRVRPPVRAVPLARLGALAEHLAEPAGTVNADVVWGVSAGARGTVTLDATNEDEGTPRREVG
ncbi:MAG: (2Fe-2S)-binding protein [Armatimonadetes bacterium]|nr:(2Fe-2S)-binding protein [Armatimonadota bacterium]